jgi:release factor glutamine methyltransferase
MKSNDTDTKRIWTVKDVLQWTANYFRESGIQSPQLNAEMIMQSVLECRRIDLYLNYDKPLSNDERAKIRTLVKKRIQHFPIQYLLGETEFYGYKFLVNENVFIPRPETETLVDSIITFIKESDKNSWEILDVGTGTGIIPIVLSLHFQNTPVSISCLAVDTSEQSLQNARKNIEYHHVDGIELRKSNLLKTVEGKFDLIVSNPPYIPTDEIASLEREVRDYEPRDALDGGKDGLLYYNQILKHARPYLTPDGKIFFEISPTLYEKIEKLGNQYGFKIIDSRKDYNHLCRVITLSTK